METKDFEKYLYWNVSLAMLMASLMLVSIARLDIGTLTFTGYIVTNLSILFAFIITFIFMIKQNEVRGKKR